ncbi:MAG: MOSC domain-containing protein, partial [Terriglobales bacterium]
RRAPLESKAEIRVVPGEGIEGDRYARTHRPPNAHHGAGHELTLVESEAIEALERDYHIHLEPGQTRRNLTTRGVPLNHLVDREFLVGDVRLRGVQLCEPCAHLERLLDKPVVPGLRHRGGLRAQVLTEGLIRVGDVVREA